MSIELRFSLAIIRIFSVHHAHELAELLEHDRSHAASFNLIAIKIVGFGRDKHVEKKYKLCHNPKEQCC